MRIWSALLTHRCTRKKECGRSYENNTWLWSPNQQCVQIQDFDPPNLSCKKTQQVQERLSEDANDHGCFSVSFPSVSAPPPRAKFSSCWVLLNLNQSKLLKHSHKWRSLCCQQHFKQLLTSGSWTSGGFPEELQRNTLFILCTVTL